ncbi:hypothetical protein [Flavobacterium sp. JP2137]|uniref:hypothetical protein n=1 Tax=Flavobacterium sp. JP2137 TaxID=3414510 RepID=UPI003D2FD88B
MMKFNRFVVVVLFATTSIFAQQKNAQETFWNQLKARCGQAYAGKMTTEPIPNDFADQALSMYVMSCSENEIKVPFYVGDDHSRTWVFTKTAQGIQLKHDHRLKDGSEDKITQYGGTTTNTGGDQIQYFPADQQTTDMLPAAAGNVWWVTIDDQGYTYNLRKVDNPNHFQVRFEWNQPLPVPNKPWGH